MHQPNNDSIKIGGCVIGPKGPLDSKRSRIIRVRLKRMPDTAYAEVSEERLERIAAELA